jgi:hypothetical protein
MEDGAKHVTVTTSYLRSYFLVFCACVVVVLAALVYLVLGRLNLPGQAPIVIPLKTELPAVQCGVVPTEVIKNGSYWQNEQRSIELAPMRLALIEHIQAHNYTGLCMSHLTTIPLCYCIINFGDSTNPAYTDVYNMHIVSRTDTTHVISLETTPFCEKPGPHKRSYGVRVIYQGKSGVRWTYTAEGEMALKLQMLMDAMDASYVCYDNNTQTMIQKSQQQRLLPKAINSS